MSFAMTDEEILRSFNTAAHLSKEDARILFYDGDEDAEYEIDEVEED